MNKRDFLENKMPSESDLLKKLAVWKFKGSRIVFTNGCFDILHRGHIEYLASASGLGDVLIVGLNTDASVKKLKGKNRPVQDEISRRLILASLQFVTAVVLFDEETPYRLIDLVRPDILVKGGDYVPEKIVGYDIVKSYGGQVLSLPFVEGYSTTSVISALNG